MKRFLAVVLVLLLAGCSSTTKPTEEVVEPTPSASEDVKGVKLGLASVTDFRLADGIVEINTTYCSLVLDEKNNITDVYFDTTQNSSKFDKTGVLEPLMAKVSKGKQKEDYGMKEYSGLNKEWYEQKMGLEQYLIGMNIDDALSIQIDEQGKATDEDLMASCTIGVSDFIKALSKAKDNMVMMNDYQSVLVNSETMLYGEDATADMMGYTTFKTLYGTVTVDQDMIITNVLLDTVESKIEFDHEGVVNKDVTEILTNKELMYDYDISMMSSLDRPWAEQIASLQQYLVGKDKSMLEAMTFDENGVTMDEELKMQIDLPIKGFIDLIIAML